MIKAMFFVVLLVSIITTNISPNCQESLMLQQDTTKFITKSEELSDALRSCYQVDQKTASILVSCFKPLLTSSEHQHLVDAFITKSKTIEIQFSNKIAYELSSNDPVLKAAQWHKVIFESAHVRILQGIAYPNDCIPFHAHQWNRLVVILQPAAFKVKDTQGVIEIDDTPMSVYEEQGGSTSYESTHVGDKVFECLVFEIKQ